MTSDPRHLPLTHLAFLLGLRANELVVERGHARGFRHVRESHGFVIQHLIDSDRTITELAERMEVSQQAASKAVAGMRRLGLLESTRAFDRRAKRIRLSAQGWKAVKLERRSRRDIDRRLSQAVGTRRYTAAKAVLAECLKTLGDVERVKTRRARQPL
jgi:DNA-binding MarR family transcriptional regulator